MTLTERLYIMDKKQEKRIKEIELIERKKEQEKEQKQYEKDLIIACKNDLNDLFDRIFSKSSASTELELQAVLTQFYNIENRNKIIAEIGKTQEEKNYINNIYDKTLNNVYKKWKNHIKYLETEKTIKEQKEKEKMQATLFWKISVIILIIGALLFAFIKWIAIIGIALGIIVFLVVLGSSKSK